MKTYTDEQLKQALAKMLPEKLEWSSRQKNIWHKDHRGCLIANVFDTELLDICWQIEEGLTHTQEWKYHLTFQDIGIGGNNYWKQYHASWQQRTIALARVKGVEIL